MTFISYIYLVAAYTVAVFLMTVNGQATTEDDIDKNEISKLIDLVTELRAELAETKSQLNHRIAKLEGQHESKFLHFDLIVSVSACVHVA